MLLSPSYLDTETQYEEAISDWLQGHKFQLFATVSLGIRYAPKDLESRLRQVLKRVTRIPYQCGFYGVYVESVTPHVHLLLKSAGEPLDASLIELCLARAFKRKNCLGRFSDSPDGNAKGAGIVNVEREHTPSVVVKTIYEITGLLRYLCQQNLAMHNQTGNEIFGNLKALSKEKNTGKQPILSDLTGDTLGGIWRDGAASQSPAI